MLLGDLIARFDDPIVAAETLLALGDLSLVGRVREAAVQQELTPGELASMAVRMFADTASDEEWVTALGQMARTPEPGLELLRRALQWSLAPQTAGCA
jgi:UDP-3-O-acyl-N-acetylglucosamine deacetylase